MSEECQRCKRIDQWIDHVGFAPNEMKRYHILLQFVKGIASRSCCNVCECIACDATKVLRELGLTNTPTKEN